MQWKMRQVETTHSQTYYGSKDDAKSAQNVRRCVTRERQQHRTTQKSIKRSHGTAHRLDDDATATKRRTSLKRSQTLTTVNDAQHQNDALVSNVRSVEATLTTTTTHDVNRRTRDQIHDEELDRRPSRCKQLESNVEVSM